MPYDDIGMGQHSLEGNNFEPNGANLCLNQQWLSISEVLWHSLRSNFTVRIPAIILYNEFQNYTFKINTTFPRVLSVNCNQQERFDWGTQFILVSLQL